MTANASTAAAELVARFRRQRPLRGGSLIVTMFGDSIMPRGGAVALGSLIALAGVWRALEQCIRSSRARFAFPRLAFLGERTALTGDALQSHRLRRQSH